MTQMSEALKGNVTPEMELVAKYEEVNVNKIIRGLSKGTIVIPKNINRKTKVYGIGEGLTTKVNANIGSSSKIEDLDLEVKKAKLAVEYGANAVISVVDSDQVVEFNGGNREMKFSNCNFYIVTNEGTLTFNVPNSTYGVMIDDKSDITFRGLITFKSTVEIGGQSNVKIENGLFDYNGQSKNIKVIQGSNATIIKNSNSTAPNNPLFTLSSNSVLITNVASDTQFYDLSDQGPCWTKIMTGLHSADS